MKVYDTKLRLLGFPIFRRGANWSQRTVQPKRYQRVPLGTEPLDQIVTPQLKATTQMYIPKSGVANLWKEGALTTTRWNVADVKLMQSSRMVCYISLLPAWRFDHASVNARPSDQRQLWSTKSDFTFILFSCCLWSWLIQWHKTQSSSRKSCLGVWQFKQINSLLQNPPCWKILSSLELTNGRSVWEISDSKSRNWTAKTTGLVRNVDSYTFHKMPAGWFTQSLHMFHEQLILCIQGSAGQIGIINYTFSCWFLLGSLFHKLRSILYAPLTAAQSASQVRRVHPLGACIHKHVGSGCLPKTSLRSAKLLSNAWDCEHQRLLISKTSVSSNAIECIFGIRHSNQRYMCSMKCSILQINR